jgi:transposase
LAGTVWDEVFDTEHAVVIRTYIERWPDKDRVPGKVLIIVVEPDEETRNRCPRWGLRGRPVEHDVKRWRTPDVRGKRTFLESQLPRIVRGEHGEITAAVPWARRDDRFSWPFEEFAAWKAAQMPRTRAAAELRITSEALASITGRVAADAAAGTDRLDGLRRIGTDEKSWGNGAGEYLVIVADHDAGRVAWGGEGRDKATVHAFFDDLGPDWTELLTHFSADGVSWIYPVAAELAPGAQICLDAFHVVKWVGDKPAELRLAGDLRATGREDEAATLGAGIWALRKDFRKLTPGQRSTLAGIAAANKPLYKGYLVEEQIRELLKVKGDTGKKLMRSVTSWAHRRRIPEMTSLARTLSRYKASMEATLDGGPSNGSAEALNAVVNALITRSRGFRRATA